MPPLPHRIRRLSLRVRATSQSQALALRKEVRDQLDTALLTALERTFDRAGALDALIHLPRVHVSVRVSGADTLAGELARCLEQELRRQLSTMAASPGRAGPAGPSGAEATERAGFAGGAPAGTDASAGEPHTSRQSRVQMLLHYLETGSLPWPLARVDPAVAVSELRDVADASLPGVLDGMTGEPVSLPAQVAFWFRWLQLLPDASWPVLARAAAPASSGQGARLAELIGALSGEKAGARSRYAQLQLAAAAIARLRRTGGLVDESEPASGASATSDGRSRAPPDAEEPGAIRTGMARLHSRPEPGLAALPRDARSRDTGERPAPFGRMVHHAGLVLLHPFLPRFFESTSIKEAGQPALTSGMLPRAAALLHLLATGEEDVLELELDFIKVLLGLPLDSPLPVSEGLLLDSDRDEVEALLSAALEHWRVLKSTSARGLRGSFLRRPGLLREEAQGFRLQVEPASFDMLLGQLPWGIGTVKLPWMKRAIFTEWPVP
jgi:hypothetical protein